MKKPKVALVHDMLREFGGAERVLQTLSEMYPKAPIYTAFYTKNSVAGRAFADKKIKQSFLAPLLKIWKLYSPLRFLTPLVWWSFNLKKYDLVITSASWYITRGFRVGPKTKVICYCHTPPRWLYGYEMSVGFTKYWPVKIYAAVVGHFMRIYDFMVSQKINHWIANSVNVQKRIKKFYKKESTVVYPVVEVEKYTKGTRGIKKGNYILVVSRLVGAKGLEEAVKAAVKLGMEIRIVGEGLGYSRVEEKIKKIGGQRIKILGRISDKEVMKQFAGAKVFLALAKDEDFGITPVEAMAAGTPVVAFNGGGFRETVIHGKTGFLIDDLKLATINTTVKKTLAKKWKKSDLQNQAKKFSKKRFKKEIFDFVKQTLKSNIS